jgi:hypothetical protein
MIMMNELKKQVAEEYAEALKLDPENTDSLFFILEDVGTENDLDEVDYQQLCDICKAL